ncbi:uncharacterized protein LOC106666734 [Cimex lectularius]|uniref:Uncharacterized protein n=1 Tax=Cimex lectularius TaxID=79782 RepID=A0A8I6THK8_CIMLE|nr:uncharacterized protein LOC106666734 [Cimex lectularius]
MEAVRRAKFRMSSYPSIVNDCKIEASTYASCVLKMNDLKRSDCQLEFNDFISCMKKSAAKRKIRL